MKIIKSIALEEYIYWYLQREFSTKEDRSRDNPEKFQTIAEMKKYMLERHSGKIREWFSCAKWFLVEINQIGFLDSLLCLHSSEPWAQELVPQVTNYPPDFRILKTVIQNAKDNNYFRSDCEDFQKRHKYFEKYKRLEQLPKLTDNNRIVLCSLNPSEKRSNPSASYYLHDGLGRLLTYLYLNKFEDKLLPLPIEAFVIENINP